MDQGCAAPMAHRGLEIGGAVFFVPDTLLLNQQHQVTEVSLHP